MASRGDLDANGDVPGFGRVPARGGVAPLGGVEPLLGGLSSMKVLWEYMRAMRGEREGLELTRFLRVSFCCCCSWFLLPLERNFW